jgi:hypothetical protein
MKTLAWILLTLCLWTLSVTAQGGLTDHTKKLDGESPKATLADVSWLTGRWVGEGLGGTLEENWSPPLAGAMVATFRLVKDGQTSFYEMCWIREKDGTLEYAVKHFHPDLKGWEEKDHHVAFPLVAIEPNAVHFHGLTLALDGDRCTHYLAMRQKDGKHREMALVYRRAEPAEAPVTTGNRHGSLDALRPLLGAWGPREAEDRVVHDYRWTVGEQAMRLREGFPLGHQDDAELDGTIFWSPERGRIEFVATAGKEKGQGRLFRGAYRVLDDGRIERVYTVHYRTPADTPGEELGGLDRRYREVYTVTSDEIAATLEWWRDGRWQPFGPGTYSLVRRK